MSWLHPALFWVWLPVLIGVPVLIHLINLLRHRRVRWATMAFLLESQKKNQNRIRFKEILLLLTRMAAIAAIVLMLAGWIINTHFSRLFSGGLVHHVLLIDDSLSMTDQWDNTDAVQTARGVVQHVLDRAAQHPGTHLVSMLRFSEAAEGRGPDVLRQPIRLDLPQERQLLVDSVRASQLAGGPLEALRAVKEKIGVQQDENLVVYVISDFRAKQWREAKPLQEAIRKLTDDKAKVELVRCVDRARSNLAITSLAPAAGILAADVPLKMDVEVTNYDSVQPARNVQVLLQSQTNGAESGAASRQALPSVTIERIEPGQTARQSFNARFPTAGDHEIYAKLGADALTADNERFCIVHLPAEVPVLIVDGRPGSIDARLLSIALSPLQRIRTGIKTQTEAPNYLREQPLDKFAAIYLVNIASLDAAEVTELNQYVAAGGGVVLFAGEATRVDFINQALYRDGQGIFPLPLASQASLIVDRLDKTPDLEVDLTHPMFRRTFAGERNSFLTAVLVDRYFAAAKDWTAPADGSVRVLARMRNKAPLVVERRTGKGTCIAVLTTAAPVWNNWARSNPSFVIAMLETQVYLASSRMVQSSQQVGRPISVEFDKAEATEVQFTLPARKKGSQRETVQAVPDPKNVERLRATLEKTPDRGIYEVRLARGDGGVQVQRFAANVPVGEGDLALLTPGDLQVALGNTSAEIHEAREFAGPVTQELGMVMGMQWPFFVVLLGLMAGEQFLAYSASYHPAKAEGRR